MPLKVIRKSKVLTLVLALLGSSICMAETGKYRLSWHGDPATSMVVGWTQAGEEKASVYYGPEDYGNRWRDYPAIQEATHQRAMKGMTHHFARLTGLKPDTPYYFVIRQGKQTSERIWFRTAPDEPEPFTFIAGGDSRNHWEARRKANRMVAKLRPLFVWFGGDFTSGDTDEEWAQWLDDWQLTRTADGRMFPILAARGNHERSDEGIHDMFDTPAADNVYATSFAGGLLRAYTLNTQIVRAGEQAEWLVTDLRRHQGVKWKFAAYHKPMRPHVKAKSEGQQHYHAWSSLFYHLGVDLVFESDSHAVKRTWPIRPSQGPGSELGFIRDDANGTVYVGEGCWGAPLRNNDDPKSWTRDSGRFNQFKWVHVRSDSIELRSVMTDQVEECEALTEKDRLKVPDDLPVWSPSNGAVVRLLPQVYSGS